MKIKEFEHDEEVVEQGDSLPPQRSYTVESGVYDVTVDLAYLLEGPTGSKQLMVHFQEPMGATIRHKFILTSGNAKGKSHSYFDRDGKKRDLPGFSHANDLTQVTLNSRLGGVDFEKRKVPIYDFEARQELPKDVLVPVEMIGKNLKVGVLKIEQNKRAQVNGEWVDTNEKQTINDISKIFDERGRTATEVRADAEPQFIEQWKERHDMNTINRYKPIAGAATPGAPPAPGAKPAPAPSKGTKQLFDDDDD